MKRRKLTKALSLILSASMALGVAAMPAAAAAEEPDGTLSAPGSSQTSGETPTPTPTATPDPAESPAPTPTAPPLSTESPTPTPSETPAPDESPASSETPAPDAEPENEDNTQSDSTEAARSLSDEELADAVSKALDNMGNVEIDLSGVEIDLDAIEPNRPIISDEEREAAMNSDDPLLAQFREELESTEMQATESAEPGIVLYSDESESSGETTLAVPSEEDIADAVTLFYQFLQHWYNNEDVLGVQLPFYLSFNEDSDDGLGMLGQMLVLAGHTVDEVRSGEYSMDDVNGMILNFLLGDQLGVQFYGTAVENARNAALQAVADSGAETEAQKLLVLNTWLAQHNTFDMSYIMNQMDPTNPIMEAPDQEGAQHPYYDQIYAVVEGIYRPQIETQFEEQFQAVAVSQVSAFMYETIIEGLVSTAYSQENPDASEEDIDSYVQSYMEQNGKAISADPVAFIAGEFGEGTAAAAQQQVESYLATEEGQAAVQNLYETLMDTQIPDLGNMTPNEAIELYVQQAASGLTTGIIGYWEGNHIGALAEGASVCMGYAKAFAYLVQAMNPAIYGVNGESSDMSDPAQWKTPYDVTVYQEDGTVRDGVGVYRIDEATGNVLVGEGEYNVDMVRITFQAAVSMYGVPQPDFSSDHFWNAVKLEDGKWYYIDPCYTDVWSEVMIRDRVETDGAMNHTYFLISDDSLRNMFSGNYDKDTGIVTLYNELADNTGYEDSWISRINSNVYSDGSYFYYLYNSTDLISMMEAYQESQENGDNNYGDLMEMNNADIKIVRHKITGADAGTDGDTNYEPLIDFTHKDAEDAEESYVAVRNASGQLMRNEMLTELYAQFKAEQEVYPSISITPVYSNGKVYFNLSNCILSYDVTTCEVVKVKEYNTVYAKRDDTVAFGAMAFDMVDSAEEADFTFENHPIAGIALKDDGKLYVDIATNLSYIAGRPDQHDYASEGYGYTYEETNYNSDYNSYAISEAEDSGMSDDMLAQIGYQVQYNDNDEFMWVANVVDTLDMAHFAGTSHTYAQVSVAATCGRDAFVEDRCTECGAIENGSRMVEENTATEHHFVSFEEEYNTTDDTIADYGTEPGEGEVSADEAEWNTGSSYVCVVCGAAVSQEEPTEPDPESMIYTEGYMDFDSAYAKYERDHALWELANVNHDAHSYVPTDAVWTDDGDGTGTVTFQELQCVICGGRKLDCLQDNADIQVTLSQQHTLDCTVEVIDSTCEGTTKVYTLAETEIEDNGKTYLVSGSYTEQGAEGAGHQATGYQHDADKHWQVCTVCGKIFNQAAHTGNPCTVCGYAATTGGDGDNQGGQTGGGSQPVDEHPDIAEGIANGTWGGTATTSASGSAEAPAPAAQQTAAIPETADEMPLQAVTIAAVLSGIAAAALVLLRKRNTDR